MTQDIDICLDDASLDVANTQVSAKRPLRVAINGFGRIGRNVLRALIERFDVLGESLHIVAINDVADAPTLLHLLKFDSTHGRLTQIGVEASLRPIGSHHRADHVAKQKIAEQTADEMRAIALNIPSVDSVCNSPELAHIDLLMTDGIELCLRKDDKTYCIPMLAEKAPIDLPWQRLQVDLVLECTGHFRSYDDAFKHIEAGAKQVIIGAAPFDRIDACVVIGVNDELLTRQLPIISSVSCTTQALVPLIDTLDKAFGIESVMMTEIHAVTADQTVLDQAHRDLRRARASGHNIIPTTSSSIAATEQVLPHIKGRINGHSIRVPTIDVAAIDVTVVFDSEVALKTLRRTLMSACSGRLQGIMAYTDEPLVSSDFIHQSESLIIDGQQLMQVGRQFKVFAWYDNEWGYANRLLDMCLYLSKRV